MAKSQYIIQFGGLSVGEHEFEFDIKESFFKQFEDSTIEKADLHVDLLLLKQNNLMQMEFDIYGSVNLSCDRCLKDVACPVEVHERLVIKHGDPAESNDEILVLKEGHDEADISQYLYEYVSLALPGKWIPCEDLDEPVACDEETLKKLSENSVTDEPENPQWNQLKNINFNNN